ncbi:MAG: chemotaxis protein CheX [Candidatus Sulfotelmatobacter sp.]
MNLEVCTSGEIESRQSWHPVLVLATQEVFETMLGSRLEMASEPPPEDALEVTGMVGLAGLLCGVLTVRCSTRAAGRMAGKMLGIEAENAVAEMWDAMGEVCNMVAGNFKNKISGLGDGCMLSVPTVITGGDYNCRSLGSASTLQANFLFAEERIVVALEIHN